MGSIFKCPLGVITLAALVSKQQWPCLAGRKVLYNGNGVAQVLLLFVLKDGWGEIPRTKARPWKELYGLHFQEAKFAKVKETGEINYNSHFHSAPYFKHYHFNA